MKTKLTSAFSPQFSAFLLGVIVSLLATTPRAPAQTGWGNALLFDGTNDYVLAGAVPLANASFTVEAWARRDTAGTMDMIVAHGGGGAGSSLMFGFHWDWVGFVFDFYGDGLQSFDIDNAWHHWAGTYDASNKMRCLYRDGVLLATNTALTHYHGSGSLYIGREPWGDPANFAGAIDDVRIWNVARTHAEIAAHMSHPLTGAEAGLLAYWTFDEAGGTNVFDSTTNEYDGHFVGAPQRTASTIPILTPPAFAACVKIAPGQLRLRAFGSAGVTYSLQISTNLVSWLDHTNCVADTNGLIECVEEMESGALARFYRLYQP